jgi:hypothetical protein
VHRSDQRPLVRSAVVSLRRFLVVAAIDTTNGVNIVPQAYHTEEGSGTKRIRLCFASSCTNFGVHLLLIQRELLSQNLTVCFRFMNRISNELTGKKHI